LSHQNGLGLFLQNVPNLAVKLYTTQNTVLFDVFYCAQSHVTFHLFSVFYILQVIGHQA